MPVGESIELNDIHKYTELEQDLYLVPIEVGQIAKLNNVFFERGKFDLLEHSYHTLNRLITFLNENPNMVIELGGHTDNTGNGELNRKLSTDRVILVKKYS